MRPRAMTRPAVACALLSVSQTAYLALLGYAVAASRLDKLMRISSHACSCKEACRACRPAAQGTRPAHQRCRGAHRSMRRCTTWLPSASDHLTFLSPAFASGPTRHRHSYRRSAGSGAVNHCHFAHVWIAAVHARSTDDQCLRRVKALGFSCRQRKPRRPPPVRGRTQLREIESAESQNCLMHGRARRGCMWTDSNAATVQSGHRVIAVCTCTMASTNAIASL